MAHLSEDAMYHAVISNEEQVDGSFYYAVKTTGIVCRPSCKSKVPNRENVTFFTMLEDALRQGYRPCKRCRPDMGVRYMPEMDAVEAACTIMNQEYNNPDLLKRLPFRVGVSSSHFNRLFKKAMGQTPNEHLQRIKIAKATELLSGSMMSNIDVCMAAGFTTLSSFYAIFRRETGLSPKEYREEQEHRRSLQ